MSNFTKTEAGREVALGMQALKRLGKPEDVADVVCFYGIRWCALITGASILYLTAVRSSNRQHEERNEGTLERKGRIKNPGADHPITISQVEGKVRVTVAGRTVAN